MRGSFGNPVDASIGGRMSDMLTKQLLGPGTEEER
jgi:hypothetical protein